MKSVEERFWENWGGTEVDGRDLSHTYRAEIRMMRKKLWEEGINTPLKSGKTLRDEYNRIMGFNQLPDDWNVKK